MKTKKPAKPKRKISSATVDTLLDALWGSSKATHNLSSAAVAATGDMLYLCRTDIRHAIEESQQVLRLLHKVKKQLDSLTEKIE